MSDTEQREVENAAAEAARIGGDGGHRRSSDPAREPLEESGGGEAEGFEQTEDALIEHASHGDQQSAHAVIHDRGELEEESAADQVGGEADREHSTELDDDR
jgi:hypothetical protein